MNTEKSMSRVFGPPDTIQGITRDKKGPEAPETDRMAGISSRRVDIVCTELRAILHDYGWTERERIIEALRTRLTARDA